MISSCSSLAKEISEKERNNRISFKGMALNLARMQPLLLVPLSLLVKDLKLKFFQAPLLLQACLGQQGKPLYLLNLSGCFFSIFKFFFFG